MSLNGAPGSSGPGSAASSGSNAAVPATAAVNTTAAPATTAPPTTTKPPNPVWRMMGLPNWRLRLPSRNWMIFLSLAGGLAAAITYDKREKRKATDRWAARVAHLADQPLDQKMLPRKLTVYLASPPGDGVFPVREHFHDYIRPILDAAGVDWDVVEGRREGDVRAALAEKVRRIRRRRGEKALTTLAEAEGGVEDSIAVAEDAVEQTRQAAGIQVYPGIGGDLVIGRHVWKEYVRGLHEGWLGSLDKPEEKAATTDDEDLTTTRVRSTNLSPPPAVPTPPQKQITNKSDALNEAVSGLFPESTVPDSNIYDDSNPTATSNVNDGSPTNSELNEVHTSTPAAEKKDEETPKPEEEEKDKKPKKRKQPSPFIYPEQYDTATASPHLPHELPPTTVLRFPHILGFRHTPVRMYRFLTRRRLADELGRATAAAMLGNSAPYDEHLELRSGNFADMTRPEGEQETDERWPQEAMLKFEEKDWPKSVKKLRENWASEGRESVWLDPVKMDERIAQRMRRFVDVGPDASEGEPEMT